MISSSLSRCRARGSGVRRGVRAHADVPALNSAMEACVELNRPSREDLAVFGIAAVLRPVPAATPDGYSEYAPLSGGTLRVEREHLGVVETNHYPLAYGPRLGQLVPVVVRPPEPA